MKPYVVSSDLSVLWRKANGIGVPDEELRRFRKVGHEMLTDMFGACDWIPERELKEGMAHLLKSNSLPVVTLDLVYAASGHELGLTRLVSAEGEDAGYGSRDGSPICLSEVVRGLAGEVCGSEIALVDDVLFSGAMFSHIIGLFQECGIRVPCVYVAVAIGEGVHRMDSIGCEVHAVRRYGDVVDEVCERDFMPGAPFSGRTLKGYTNTGMPYLLPFGKPGAWASIPQAGDRRFSASLLRASAEIYLVMQTKFRELPRRIHGLEADGDFLVGELLEYIADEL